jgi:hypothetical protein
VKKLAIVLLLVVASCKRQATVVTTVPVAGQPGAATPREALRGFLAAAKAQDLQAMAMMWGTKDGPAAGSMDRSEMERREIVLTCYLKHDSFQILNEAPAANDERQINVELKYKTLTRSTNFYVTPARENRWYVRTFEADALRDICANR